MWSMSRVRALEAAYRRGESAHRRGEAAHRRGHHLPMLMSLMESPVGHESSQQTLWILLEG